MDRKADFQTALTWHDQNRKVLAFSEIGSRSSTFERLPTPPGHKKQDAALDEMRGVDYLSLRLPKAPITKGNFAMGLNIERLATNKYFLDVRVRRPGGVDRIRETFEGTKAAAEERYIQLRKQIKESQALQCRFETFGDLIRYYSEKRGGLSYKDKSAFALLDQDLGETSLPNFPARLEAYIAHRRKYPSKKTGRPYSNGSINKTLTLVRAAFNVAVNLELIEKNPITLARFPKLKEVPRDAALSPDAVRNLINYPAASRGVLNTNSGIE